jgi:hypothetical protein
MKRYIYFFYATFFVVWTQSHQLALGQQNDSYLSVNEANTAADKVAGHALEIDELMGIASTSEMKFVVTINEDQRKLFYKNYTLEYAKYTRYFDVSFGEYGLMTDMPVEWKILFKGLEPTEKKTLVKLLTQCNVKEVVVGGKKKQLNELVE